ncbi:MAG: glycosyltransferase family 4 protein [Bacteroidetes bacterium]|nr:glycosyltransferase family 4 protein [Bacteroidota bacterium]MBL6943938.1 glycosyltransferase family 4 protein [Bacteroidales bacterium]
MKITYLIPGSGDNFYCGNCQRDTLYVSWLKKIENIEVSAIPLYLPPGDKNFGGELENEVFFGAVSLYLKEKVPLFRSMPTFVDRLLDSPSLLNFAAKQAGTTNPIGLEETTLSMIRTNDPSREKEISRLAKFIHDSGGTDIIHISNALIMGVAVQLKKVLGKPVVCSLQNEDDWIDEMKEPYGTMAWQLISAEEKHIDLFITTSHYFKKLIISKTGISEDKIYVVPSALEVVRDRKLYNSSEAPSIGYYSRLNKMNGLDKIIDAYIIIRKRNTHPGLKLHLSGGYTSDEKGFIKEQTTKLKKEGLENDVILYNAFSGAQKQSFFNSIDLLSVPVRKHDAYGLYLLEAISSAVPVVQPHTGAFPEIVESTKGGVTYTPDTVEKLAETLDELLNDREKLHKIGLAGRETISQNLTPKAMALGLIEVYKKLTKTL